MEIVFLVLLIVFMIWALGSGYPVAFALPGAAILTVGLAALTGWLFAGDVDAYFARGGPAQWLTSGVTNFRGVYWEAERDTLIAVPLFVFMGIMLQRSRIAEDLLVTMAQLFGPVRGGLGISVVLVGGLLAATTGIVGATVVAMGLISLPAMLRSNYSHPLATGTIAASGTLGQIIPPSIVLIILADQLASAADQASSVRKALYKAATGQLAMPADFGIASTSAGEMFLGAIVPGLILVAVYIVYIAILAFVKPDAAPAVPYAGKYDARFARRVFLALAPPLVLIVVVLGSIMAGVATVNQAGAVGATGAIIMAGYRLREGHPRAYWPVTIAVASVLAIFVITHIHPLNIKNVATSADVFWISLAMIAVAAFVAALIWSGWRALRIENTLQDVMVETAKTTSLVFVILIGAAMLTAAFRGFGGEDLVRAFLTGLPGGFWGQFAIVMGVIFLLGFFIDFIEIAVVVVPVVAPILLADPGANITAVWLGVIIGVNLQTSFLTPPFGFALFYLRGVAPAVVRTLSIYRGVVPFIGLQLLVLAVVSYAPWLVNYLPQRIALDSETAPPPINPKMQICLERIVFEDYRTQGAAIRAAIAAARTIDLSSLPDRMRAAVGASFDKAERTFALADGIRKAEGDIETRAKSYRPLHAEVREIQAQAKLAEGRVGELRTLIGRLADDEAGRRRKQKLEAEATRLEGERKAALASIPAEWRTRNEAFTTLVEAETKLRGDYRRNVDDAYEPIRNAVETIDAAGALAGMRDGIGRLRAAVAERPADETAERIGQAVMAVNAIPGGRVVGAELDKARRALRGRSPDKAEALKALEAAQRVLAAELAWRERAARDVLPRLAVYEAAIAGTIGLRQQPRLPEERRAPIASCLSHHRDISLYF